MANLPFESLHFTVLAGAAVGHFTNLPFASRQGAASDDAEPVMRPIAAKPMISLRMLNLSSFLGPELAVTQGSSSQTAYRAVCR